VTKTILTPVSAAFNVAVQTVGNVARTIVVTVNASPTVRKSITRFETSGHPWCRARLRGCGKQTDFSINASAVIRKEAAKVLTYGVNASLSMLRGIQLLHSRGGWGSSKYIQGNY
jgi:hypothetical protein